jgi:phosphatidylglycerophosphatase A
MPRLIASWFGTGLLLGRARGDHTGSGTIGSLFAMALALLVGTWGGWGAQLAATVVIVGLAYWSIDHFAESEGDASWIVVDEAAGMSLALVGLTAWPAWVVAFVVFRVADIFKRSFPGVAAAERAPGATGIIADDLVAGLYGLVAGQVVQLLI